MKFLLVILLIYLVFRFVTRTLLPYFVKRYVNKAQQNFYQQNPNTDPQEAKRKEGEVNIKEKPQSSGRKKEALGDYVDFEELDD